MRGASWLCVAALAALFGGAAGRAAAGPSQTVDGVPAAEIERSGRYPLDKEGRDALHRLLAVIRAGTTREKFIADLDAAVARTQGTGSGARWERLRPLTRARRPRRAQRWTMRTCRAPSRAAAAATAPWLRCARRASCWSTPPSRA